MRRHVLVLLAPLVAACGGPAPPPLRLDADVKQLMAAVIDPNADIVWDAVGTIDTPGFTEHIYPTTNEDWDRVASAAWVLNESANSLMIGNRPKDTTDWMQFSREMSEQSLRAVRAAEARDADTLFTVGGDIYEACTNCHAHYNLDLTKPAEQ